MKERGIIFSAPMVRAILDGSKTQTRRILKPQAAGNLVAELQHSTTMRSPYGVSGDRLWVKETIKLDALGPPVGRAWASYPADDSPCDRISAWPWKRPLLTAIHCPRGASRITLDVTGVRVERLQAIAEADAKAEGVQPFPLDLEGDCWTDGTYRTAYNYLWNEINGWNPNSWAANPWVWVVEFKVVES
jgi:hypothetical protein